MRTTPGMIWLRSSDARLGNLLLLISAKRPLGDMPARPVPSLSGASVGFWLKSWNVSRVVNCTHGEPRTAHESSQPLCLVTSSRYALIWFFGIRRGKRLRRVSLDTDMSAANIIFIIYLPKCWKSLARLRLARGTLLIVWGLRGFWRRCLGLLKMELRFVGIYQREN